MSHAALRRCAVRAVSGLLLAAAATAVAYAHHPSPNVGAQAAVAAADWSEAIEVVIDLGDHHYAPSEFTLKLGRPYKISLRNVGATSHDMVGGSFFDAEAIALRMVSSSAGRVIADNVNSIYVRPKHDIDLWLVPLKEGEYSFFCSLPGHRDDGMEGVVRVVR